MFKNTDGLKLAECWGLQRKIQQNSTRPNAGYVDRQLSGSAWPYS
jgi:hypothetical protein